MGRTKLPSGKKIDYHALEFPMKVAGILPVRDDGKILLTLQYRYMAGQLSWEIPAGNLDEAEDLINIGAYVKGSNPQIDHALNKITDLRSFMKQDMFEKADFSSTVQRLNSIIETPLV